MTEQHAPHLANRTDDVDDKARTLAFTALALALVALMGGGVFAHAAQWVLLDGPGMNGYGGDTFTLAIVAGPLCLGVIALALGLMSGSSQDNLARPVGRAAVFVAGVALLGSLVLVLTSPSLAG